MAAEPTEPVSPTIVILIDIASRLSALREAVAQMDPPGRVTRIQPEPVQPGVPTDPSGLHLSLQQAQELYWMLDVFRLRLDSTFAEAEYTRDQLQAGAPLGTDALAIKDIRQTCADVLGITLDPRDDTLTLFRRVVERAQADARALRDLNRIAEVRLEVLSGYSSGTFSGNAKRADDLAAEAERLKVEGRLVNAANAQALCLINRLLVALDEQNKESKRRHRVAQKDLHRHQESAGELAELVNAAHDELDRLGVPAGGKDIAGRIRAFARADRHTPALLAEAAKSCAMALLEEAPENPEAQVALIQRTAAQAAQARCTLTVLDGLDVERPLTLDDVAAHQGAATAYAAQGMPLLAKVHRLAAAAIGYRLLGRVDYRPAPAKPAAYPTCRHCGASAIRVDGPCGSCGKPPFTAPPTAAKG